MGTSTNPYAPTPAKPPVTPQNPAQPQEPAKPAVDPEMVPDGPAAAVLKWVGKDSDRAQRALDAEEAGQQRVGLVKKLKELV